MATPTLAGCAAVLPPVNVCLSNRAAAGCAGILPPAQNAANSPVTQALNATVNIINSVSPWQFDANAAKALADAALAAKTDAALAALAAKAVADTKVAASTTVPADDKPADKKEEKKEEKREEKKEEKVAPKEERRNEPPPPKTFCN
jgi:hypothetical protein